MSRDRGPAQRGASARACRRRPTRYPLLTETLTEVAQ